MKMCGRRCFRSGCSSGLTLVELMVALVMGLVLLGGMITIFIANKQTYRVQEAVANVQENGRFALTMLIRDIRMAGYRGCATRSVLGRAKNTIDRTQSGQYFLDFDVAIDGADYDGSPTGLSAEVAAYFAKLKSDGGPGIPVAGSDVITVRSIAPCPGDRVLEDQRFDNPANFKITANGCIKECDFVLVTDCVNAAIFQATNVSKDTAEKSTIVHAPGATACKLGNWTKDLGADFSGAEIFKMRSATYYVGETSRGVPALYLIENAGYPPLELVEGVENMQLHYGEDAGGSDQSADSYVSATSLIAKSTPPDWGSVVSARVDLLLRSADNNPLEAAQPMEFMGNTINSAGSADKRLRQIFGAVATVRNQVP